MLPPTVPLKLHIYHENPYSIYNIIDNTFRTHYALCTHSVSTERIGAFIISAFVSSSKIKIDKWDLRWTWPTTFILLRDLFMLLVGAMMCFRGSQNWRGISHTMNAHLKFTSVFFCRSAIYGTDDWLWLPPYIRTTNFANRMNMHEICFSMVSFHGLHAFYDMISHKMSK